VAPELPLQRCKDWLRADGKLFISVLTPDGEHWSNFKREYACHYANNVVWPGAADSRRPHLLDQHVLQRELTRAGFAIEELLEYPLAWDSSQICCGVVATPLAR